MHKYLYLFNFLVSPFLCASQLTIKDRNLDYLNLERPSFSHELHVPRKTSDSVIHFMVHKKKEKNGTLNVQLPTDKKRERSYSFSKGTVAYSPSQEQINTLCDVLDDVKHSREDLITGLEKLAQHVATHKYLPYEVAHKLKSFPLEDKDLDNLLYDPNLVTLLEDPELEVSDLFPIYTHLSNYNPILKKNSELIHETRKILLYYKAIREMYKFTKVNGEYFFDDNNDTSLIKQEPTMTFDLIYFNKCLENRALPEFFKNRLLFLDLSSIIPLSEGSLMSTDNERYEKIKDYTQQYKNILFNHSLSTAINSKISNI